ncbi:hypothetical protein EYF80_024944 [Liparis tanakae]|uniref:Uncharacterized protein n=1 Tax=Liparis tanakae TaxID=230148 RepID=A0A4Z2HIT6_9TELE|nr:hypothetical protein EYF80_024944 [Liparis tanakae]
MDGPEVLFPNDLGKAGQVFGRASEVTQIASQVAAEEHYLAILLVLLKGPDLLLLHADAQGIHLEAESLSRLSSHRPLTAHPTFVCPAPTQPSSGLCTPALPSVMGAANELKNLTKSELYPRIWSGKLCGNQYQDSLDYFQCVQKCTLRRPVSMEIQTGHDTALR